jgi:pimeloyl-ACP methyl ester carboxylesterase
VELADEFQWRGRRVAFWRMGTGPDVVFCHGTPWSAELWWSQAVALSTEFTVHLWDMPGYGRSSKQPDQRVSLDVQAELLCDLMTVWQLRSPHVVAHDYGGAVALRAHLLHRYPVSSLALVDVVALAPWGSDFFRLVRENPAVFSALPAAIHAGVVRAYVQGAAHVELTPPQLDVLVSPWLGDEGQSAFYRQISQADERYTDEVEPRYRELEVPTLIVWGRNDTWIPVDRAQRLNELIPGSRLEVIEDAGHLIQLDQPAQLATSLHRWLTSRSSNTERP